MYRCYKEKDMHDLAISKLNLHSNGKKIIIKNYDMVLCYTMPCGVQKHVLFIDELKIKTLIIVSFNNLIIRSIT